VLSAAGWTLVLYRALAHLSGRPAPFPSSSPSSSFSLLQSLKKPSGIPLPVWVPSIVPAHLVPLYQRACTTFDAVGDTTAVVQSAAVLEVLHVLLGLVRSPLPTTAVQVASRLFSVWCIADRFPSVRRPSVRLYLNQSNDLIVVVSYLFMFFFVQKAQRSPFYASMVLSWALTEVIRYTFYAASLVGWEFGPLLWARYSTFFVLYPTGAGSEALVNFATLPISVASGGSWLSVLPFAQWDTYALLRGVLFVVWWPGELLSRFIPVSLFFPFLGVSVPVFFPMLTEEGVGVFLRRLVSDVCAYDQATP
jgi:very-long-chain (3R)-3-hydroxyacyl-CoA dehydratase